MEASIVIEPTVRSPKEHSSTTWQGPLFLVGMQRSGTSLLYALMNKHPQIALMYEADLFRLTPFLRAAGKTRGWRERCEFWNQVFARHALDSSDALSGVSSLRSGMKTIYQDYARQKGALIWGDKSPNYHDYLVPLWQDFPQAKFVIIWRDPLAICRSIARAAAQPSWFDRTGMHHRILMGYRLLKADCDRLVNQGARIYQLHYEELVRDPVQTMEGICAFLGIQYVPEMASLGGADRSAIYEGRHHSLVKGERVLAHVERVEVLPKTLKEKIERYVCMWQRESGGTWPVSEVAENRAHQEPSLVERILDRIWYRCLRAFDFLTTLAYFVVPGWILQGWRRFQQRRRDSQGESAGAQ